MKRLVWFVFLAGLAISCLDPADCLQKNNNIMGVSFRTMYDGRGDTVKIQSVTVAGIDHQFDTTTVGTAISVQLNYLTDTSTFRIQTLDRLYYLKVGYSVKPQFVAVDCSEKFTLGDLKLLASSGTDSVKVISTTLVNPTKGNINIYRCPRNKIIKFSFRQYYMDTDSIGKLTGRKIASVVSDFAGVIYPDTITTNTVYLPINISASQSAYTFYFADGTVSKLSINYDVMTKTVLSLCGPQLFPRKIKHVPQGGGLDFEVLKVKRDSVFDPPRTNFNAYACAKTNLITTLFKTVAGGYTSDTLKSVKADYLGATPIYKNLITGSVVLPLNTDADNTTFFFEYQNKTSAVTLNYLRTGKTYHTECGVQQEITQLQVLQSNGFSAAPKVIQAKATFPASNNLEITK